MSCNGHLHGLLGLGRRIFTEEKAKVVAISWGTEFIQFFAALAILHQDELKNRTICAFYSLTRLGVNQSILQIVQVKNS